MIVRRTDEFAIHLIRGDTYTFCIELDGNIASADIKNVTLTVKRTPQHATVILQKTLGDGIELLSESIAANGKTTLKYKFKIEHNDTKDIPVKGYYYDVSFKMTNNEYYTPLRGRFCVDYDITMD